MDQRVLPFFEVGNVWHYRTVGQPDSTLLQRLHMHESNLGNVGLASIAFALRHTDATYVCSLSLTCAEITQVGCLARLIKSDLPALVEVKPVAE